MSYVEKQIYIVDTLKAAIDKWGKDLQIEMAIEECAELIKALQKLKRYSTHENRMNVCDEIADVDIMISQLKLIFPIQAIEEYKILKIERLKERIQSTTD